MNLATSSPRSSAASEHSASHIDDLDRGFFKLYRNRTRGGERTPAFVNSPELRTHKAVNGRVARWIKTLENWRYMLSMLVVGNAGMEFQPKELEEEWPDVKRLHTAYHTSRKRDKWETVFQRLCLMVIHLVLWKKASASTTYLMIYLILGSRAFLETNNKGSGRISTPISLCTNQLTAFIWHWH